MAYSLNEVTLVGRLGSDPETMHFESGAMKASASLCTSNFFKSMSGEKKEISQWHKLIFWNKQAELASKYVRKGNRILVKGQIQYRSYTKNDETRYITEINVYKVMLLGSVNKDAQATVQHPVQQQVKQAVQQPVQKPAQQQGLTADYLSF